ncbi:MAG: hypothetical protein ACTHK7_10475 [Aureliella sp.]
MRNVFDPDTNSTWSMAGDHRQTFVVDETTGKKLYVMQGRFAPSVFIPGKKELVYIDPDQRRLYRISLPSGQTIAAYEPWKNHGPMTVAWCLAVACWLSGWLLLWTWRGGLWWIDIPALSISAMLLSAAFHLPLLDLDHMQLTISLLMSLAVIGGFGAGSLEISRPLIASAAIAVGATLAFCLSLAANGALNRELVARTSAGLIAIACGLCAATVWHRSTGRRVAHLQADIGVRRPHPRSHLLHVFILTASCAYLLIVAQRSGVMTAKWNQQSLVNAIQLPALVILLGCAATSVGLDPRRWMWIVPISYVVLGCLAFALLRAQTSPLARTIALGPRTPVGVDPLSMFSTGAFIGLWVYALRTSGLRMRRYVTPEPPDPWTD